MEKNIANQTFDGEKFYLVDGIVGCNFENVIFSNCKFSQKIENCTFKNCQFINCKMYDTLFRWNLLEDCFINNIVITNNSSVRENKFINTKINNFKVVALGLCYNEYIDCVFDDISDLIVLRRDDTNFPNPYGTVISITNNTYHNCLVDFNSIKKLAESNFGSIMMGGSRNKPKKGYPLDEYMDDNNCEVVWDFANVSYEQRLYYIVALTMFFINVYVHKKNIKCSDVTLKFIRTEFSNEIKFLMDDKYLDTTLVEPITSTTNDCFEIPVPLTDDVPNLLDEKYWKPIDKEFSLLLKKSTINKNKKKD